MTNSKVPKICTRISYFFEDITVEKWRSTDRGKQEEIIKCNC